MLLRAPTCNVPETYTRGSRIQDIGSQSIVPLLDLAPGQLFLDLCAAPGNKTAQALEAGVRAVACDLHWSRLAPLKSLGIDLVLLDARQPLPFPPPFRPHSGRRALLRHGHAGAQPGNQVASATRQDCGVARRCRSGCFGHALDALAPGGRLVYSTCSLEREENEDVVEGLASQTMRRLPGRDPGDGFFAAVIESEYAPREAAR